MPKLAAISQDSLPQLEARSSVMTLSHGVHLFRVSVLAEAQRYRSEDAPFRLPIVCLAPVPGQSARVKIAGRGANLAWLHEAGQIAIVTVEADEAEIFVTSLPTPEGDLLPFVVEKLGEQAEAADPLAASASRAVVGQSETSTDIARVTAVAGSAAGIEILAHIRNRGDMTFVDADWAGRVGAGLWIEAFAIRPQTLLAAEDVEYRGLTASGGETPWVSGGEICGFRGHADPLVAFMIRLKPEAARTGYSCQYGGYFHSGHIVGPIKNGAPCRSPQKDDPLEGIQLRIVADTASA